MNVFLVVQHGSNNFRVPHTAYSYHHFREKYQIYMKLFFVVVYVSLTTNFSNKYLEMKLEGCLCKI